MHRRLARLALAAFGGALLWPMAVMADDDDGISERYSDRVMVQIREDVEDALESFLAAIENHPSLPGITATLVDAVPHRRAYLIDLEAPEGVDLDELEIDDSYDEWLDWGESLFERDAPEGSTGSTWISGIDVGRPDFEGQYARAALGLDGAHAMSMGAGVVVAVLDTGLDATHELFAGRLAPGGYDYIDHDSDPDDVGNGEDDDLDGLTDEMAGHGTFVSGLVVLTAPEVLLLPLRVLDSEGNGDSWSVLRGLYHAIDQGVEVINLSLRSTDDSEGIERAIEEARELGIVVVAAAGNHDRSDPEDFPAMERDAIGVAALDDQDHKASWSNYNEDLFISAPGASLAIEADGDPDPTRSIISAVPGGDYVIWEGTSMAVPLVSGAVALMRAQYPDHVVEESMVEFVEELLEQSAAPIDAINPLYSGELGVGRLDAGAATLLGPVARYGDLDADGDVGFNDLLVMLRDWGAVHSMADLDGSGRVDFTDLIRMLALWG